MICNGARFTVESAADTSLLWVLRGELGLAGTRFGCGAGLCGCCAVRATHSPCRTRREALADAPDPLHRHPWKFGFGERQWPPSRPSSSSGPRAASASRSPSNSAAATGVSSRPCVASPQRLTP
ncbi:MAG TPA: 2Fe-2S iron-sulfur cluster-binding protein [Stellaceae bacterium]|nr:2Fe-2S iron-sulfur cluster-binding protein [Stellaceae bacterium]